MGPPRSSPSSTPPPRKRTRVVVLHVGSRWLRLGRALPRAQEQPVHVEQCIASLRGGSPPTAPPRSTRAPAPRELREEALKRVCGQVGCAVDSSKQSGAWSARALPPPDVAALQTLLAEGYSLPEHVGDSDLEDEEESDEGEEDEEDEEDEEEDRQAEEQVQDAAPKHHAAVDGSTAVATPTTTTIAAAPPRLARESGRWRGFAFGRAAAECGEALGGAEVRWPLHGGRFHVTASSSFHQVAAEVALIWEWALHSQLRLSAERRRRSHCVLLLPSALSVREVKALVDVAVRELGFASVVLHRESVAACFAFNCAVGCVVRVGATSCAVSCVEDGVEVAPTRTRLGYGGDDLVDAMRALLARQGRLTGDFARRAALRYSRDYCQLEQLTTRACRLQDHEEEEEEVEDEGADGAGAEQEQPDQHPPPPLPLPLPPQDEGAGEGLLVLPEGVVELNGKQIKLGSAHRVAPMVLFFPTLLEGSSSPYSQERPMMVELQALRDHEDYLDEEYLEESAPRTRDSKKEQLDKEEPAPEDDALVLDRKSTTIASRAAKGAESMPLPEAVAKSIAVITSAEMQKKISANILLVGEQCHLPGLQQEMESRLQPQMKKHTEVEPERIQVTCDTTGNACWKGGVILCKVDTSRESWIKREEWLAGGAIVGEKRKLQLANTFHSQCFHYVGRWE